MKKINFEKMLVAMDVARKHCINRDYREDLRTQYGRVASVSPPLCLQRNIQVRGRNGI